MPTPVVNSTVAATNSRPSSSDEKNSAISQTPPRREMQRDAGQLVGDVGIGLTRRQDRRRLRLSRSCALPVRRVIPAREVSRARTRAEFLEQHVVAAAATAFRDRRTFVFQVAEHDRPWSGMPAGRR